MHLFGLKKKQAEFFSPVSGRVKPLLEGRDPVFAEGLMGPGCFIEPENGKICAPCTGRIVSVFPTQHALGIRSKEGVELILHIGVDTVELKGELFKGYVTKNQQVKKGDLLVECEFEEMKKRNIITDVFLVFPDRTQEEIQINYGSLEVGDKLLSFIG